MGCTTSRQARHDLRHCPSPLLLPRCQSFPAARFDLDFDAAAGVHVVRLTSSTLGSLELDKAAGPWAARAPATTATRRPTVAAPRTPTMTPPNEPEPIDAWALMAGLEEDHSPLLAAPFARHSFSFPTPAATAAAAQEFSKVSPMPSPAPARKRKRAVLYFTSLRGVRATHEGCSLARDILRGYGVRVDERDVSMHRGFRDELHGLLGDKLLGWAGPAILPSLFVDGELVGHAEEMKRMHETGELAARLAGCESSSGAGACEACGDARFVLCETCSGSCKVYVEEEDDDEEELGEGGGAGFRRCSECNENGIVRCPVCCCS
ncbi:uncharacterized protein At5g39865 [Brachypodium distachyon]|uniref:Glutaredoxin domain-containing protein n=1 Tax=Brachypodium distachyon TaxID=15368 RepID=I1H975_BRADI|nr:uncharacterized protein At5g39865 [Brachypodium distachyon]KQK23404.1 hypothetical protein BRADI_1g73180v3 [Brachypodium distachyon]|eukprot:XP_003562010.1 uncharacterized protein At5g39865 [Brachypodium distachyon]